MIAFLSAADFLHENQSDKTRTNLTQREYREGSNTIYINLRCLIFSFHANIRRLPLATHDRRDSSGGRDALPRDPASHVQRRRKSKRGKAPQLR
jgi:hypothetical protein